MSNGQNEWGVTFGRIGFLDDILTTHKNLLSVTRDQDILFTVEREKPNDQLRILCADEYAFGLLLVRRALAEFKPLHVIYVGGAWNGYTPEAKEYCLDSKIGLYNAGEIGGGLWQPEYWKYAKRDEKGNRVYSYKAA
ncbi:MAG: hypothetical protein V4444_03635 [Pseudomonadota bacterium]